MVSFLEDPLGGEAQVRRPLWLALEIRTRTWLTIMTKATAKTMDRSEADDARILISIATSRIGEGINVFGTLSRLQYFLRRKLAVSRL